MAFTENLKLEVKKKSAFRCCRCQAVGVEIHHIVPQAENGPDTFDNAAPLCSKCHSDFGDNPKKRKEITQMRDWWYETVEGQYATTDPRFSIIEEKLDILLSKSENKEISSISEIKRSLREYVDIVIQSIDTENVKIVASNIMKIEKTKFIPGSPCQMSGQPCPSASCQNGIMDIDPGQSGMMCNECGLFIPAGNG